MSNYYITSTGVNMSQMFKVDDALGIDYGYGVKLVPYDGNTSHKNTTLSNYKFQGTDLTNLCSANYTTGTTYASYTTNFTNAPIPNGYTVVYQICGGSGGGGGGGRGLGSPYYAVAGGGGGGHSKSISGSF
jgi:hypothetical protein